MSNPRQCLVEIAKTQLAIHETSPNRGAGIEKYWTATNYTEGYSDRQPYCAAFLCWIIREAMSRGNPLGLTDATRPKSAAVPGWIPWAMKPTSGAVVFHIGDHNYSPQPGDVVSFIYNSSGFSHIGLVTAPLNGGYIETIEANTNKAGGRDGDGVYKKVRASNLCKAFIRIAAKASHA